MNELILEALRLLAEGTRGRVHDVLDELEAIVAPAQPEQPAAPAEGEQQP